jgi:mono/diheme cytochrome c family protein
MRKRLRHLLLPFLGAAALVLTCGCSGKPEPSAPAVNMPPGELMYRRYCAGCHGDTGRGDGAAGVRFNPPPTDFLKRPWKRGDSPEAIRKSIVEGVPPAMGPLQTLTREELDALVEYVVKLSKQS